MVHSVARRAIHYETLNAVMYHALEQGSRASLGLLFGTSAHFLLWSVQADTYFLCFPTRRDRLRHAVPTKIGWYQCPISGM